MAEQTRGQLTHRMEALRGEANADEELVRNLTIGIDAMTQAQGRSGGARQGQEGRCQRDEAPDRQAEMSEFRAPGSEFYATAKTLADRICCEQTYGEIYDYGREIELCAKWADCTLCVRHAIDIPGQPSEAEWDRLVTDLRDWHHWREHGSNDVLQAEVEHIDSKSPEMPGLDHISRLNNARRL